MLPQIAQPSALLPALAHRVDDFAASCCEMKTSAAQYIAKVTSVENSAGVKTRRFRVDLHALLDAIKIFVAAVCNCENFSLRKKIVIAERWQRPIFRAHEAGRGSGIWKIKRHNLFEIILSVSTHVIHEATQFLSN